MKRKIITLFRSSVMNILALGVLVMPMFLFVPSAASACRLYAETPTNRVIVPWYKYLEGRDVEGQCRLNVSARDFRSGKTISLIAMAIIELLMRIAGLIAVGYIIYGAIQYIMSQGEPEGLKNAKDTITNALIGFIIVILATAIVQFLGRALQ